MPARDTADSKRRRSHAVWFVALVLAIVLGRQMLSSRMGLLGVATSITEEPGAEVEELSPSLDFSLKDLSGRPVQLSDLRGEVVLVNFWATWCPPCREEMPLLQEYYLAHEAEGFTLVGVNVSDRPEAAARFVEENGYVFKVWLDPPGNVLIDLGINGLPVSLLVDEEGRLRESWIGPLTSEVLEAEVTPLLSSSAY